MARSRLKHYQIKIAESSSWLQDWCRGNKRNGGEHRRRCNESQRTGENFLLWNTTSFEHQFIFYSSDANNGSKIEQDRTNDGTSSQASRSWHIWNQWNWLTLPKKFSFKIHPELSGSVFHHAWSFECKIGQYNSTFLRKFILLNRYQNVVF